MPLMSSCPCFLIVTWLVAGMAGKSKMMWKLSRDYKKQAFLWLVIILNIVLKLYHGMNDGSFWWRISKAKGMESAEFDELGKIL